MKNRFSGLFLPMLGLYLLLFGFSMADTRVFLRFENFYAAIALAQIPIYLFPYAVYLYFHRDLVPTSFGFSALFAAKRNKRPFFRLWLCLLLLLLTFSAFLQLCLYRAGFISLSTEPVLVDESVRKILHPALTVLVMGVLPTILEELVFRGLFYRDLRKHGCRPILAAVVSALFFAMMHFDLAFFSVYFLGGLVFCTVAQLGNSLFSAILLHIAYNLGSLLGTNVLQMLSRKASVTILTYLLLGLLFFLCLFFALGYASKQLRIYKTGEKQIPIPSGIPLYREILTLTGNLPFWFCITVFVLACILL